MQPDLGLESVTPRTHPIRPAPAVDKEERRTSAKTKFIGSLRRMYPSYSYTRVPFPH